MEKQFDASEMLADLDASVFMQKVSRAFADAATATCDHDRQSKVILEFGMKRLGDSSQVVLSHSVKLEKPTRRGKLTDVDTTSTPMFVGPRGALSVMPFKQGDLFLTETEDSQT